MYDEQDNPNYPEVHFRAGLLLEYASEVYGNRLPVEHCQTLTQ